MSYITPNYDGLGIQSHTLLRLAILIFSCTPAVHVPHSVLGFSKLSYLYCTSTHTHTRTPKCASYAAVLLIFYLFVLSSLFGSSATYFLLQVLPLPKIRLCYKLETYDDLNFSKRNVDEEADHTRDGFCESKEYLIVVETASTCSHATLYSSLANDVEVV